jgi:hypothetical protein
MTMDANMLDFQPEGFEEFEYQLLYLKPTEYADERIVVGAVSLSQARVETRLISTPSAIDHMVRLFGEEGVEQFNFAAAELRRAASGWKSLDSAVVPTDLLVLGERQFAYTKDRYGLIGSVLNSASVLLRANSRQPVSEPLNGVSSPPFTRDIFEHVSQLNPLVADAIFDRKVPLQTGETVELPIYGSKIFGAPVSFAAKQQQQRAEAYVAKFHWLSTLLTQRPRVYVFRPQSSNGVAALDRDFRELSEIAKASKVPLRIAESKGEIAAQILQDEAA